MKKILWSLVVASMVANAWLLKHLAIVPLSPSEKTSATTSAVIPVKAAPAMMAASAATPSEKQQRIAALVRTLVSLDSSDPAGARDRLRAAGADEATVYAVIDGILRLRYYQGKRIAETENINNGWWRGNPSAANQPNAPLWGKDVVEPVLKLVGYDPHDLKDLGSRFDFLPPEKAQVLAKMMFDYFAMIRRFQDDNRVANDSRGEQAADEMVTAEREKDLQKVLTPQERAEYDLRFSPAAAQNVQRFAKMQVTEEEFRAIMPLVERAQQETAALPRDQNYTAASRALEQQTFDTLVAAVGYERATDYAWSGTTVVVRDPDNPNTIVLSASSSSPRLMQLAAETGAQAAAIHNDTSRSPEEKRAALLALQQATQPKLEKILPPEGRSGVEAQSLAWFDVLAKGQYVTLPPPRVAGGITTTVVQPISVTAPVRGAPQATPVLRQSK